MNFEKDVFISYAHIDDQTMSEGLKGWITEFHKALEVRLSQILGSEPKIWRDAKLQGNDFFAPEIESQFPKLKIMISIITPRYVQSEWCTKEVELFYDAASKSGGIAIDNKARIFKVLKTPVEIEEQPVKIRPLLGYEFYRRETDSNRIREYGLKKEKEDAYWDTLSDVAYDIAGLIEKLNDKSSNGNKPDITYTIEVAQEEKQKIYLAETSTDLKDLRRELARELKDNGYVVLPEDYPSEFEIEKYQSWVKENMEKCSLVVQLIGSKYGAIPETNDDEEKSIVVIQNEIATALCDKKDLTRLIWIPEIQKSEDHRVIALIEQLKKQNLKEGSEWLNGTIKEFTERIKSTMQKLEAAERERKAKEEEKARLAAAEAKQKEQASNNPNAGNSTTQLIDEEIEIQTTTVFLIYDERDKENVKELRKYLKSKDIYVDTITFDGTEQEKNLAYEESMRNCDAVLIYFGQGSTSWLKPHINKVIQKPALKGKPLKAALIYKGLPASDDKAEYDEPPRFMVADGQQGFNQDLFNEFLAKIK